MDLEVKVAAGAGGVAGFADQPDRLSLPESLPAPGRRRVRQVGIEVAAPLAFAVEQQVPAVENGVEAAPQHLAVAHRYQPRSASGGHVEAFVNAAAAARRVELADRASHPVRPPHGENVAVVGDASVGTDPCDGRGGCDESNDQRDPAEVPETQSATLMFRTPGVGSTSPVGPIALTLKTCLPSASPL